MCQSDIQPPVVCAAASAPAPAREITERPHAPSGVAAFMSAHSKTPYITPSMDFSSGKGVVRGRRGQQAGFTLAGSTAMGPVRMVAHRDVHRKWPCDVACPRLEVVDLVACPDQCVVEVIVQPVELRVHVRVVNLDHADGVAAPLDPAGRVGHVHVVLQ